MSKDIHDYYCWTRDRKILTEMETGIVGLESFGYNHQITAKHPQDIHFHRDAIELTYIINGEYYLNINGMEYIATGGDLVITQPNELHSTGMAPRTVSEFYWMHIRMDSFEDFMGLASPWNKVLFDTLLSVKGYLFHIGLSFEKSLQDALQLLSQQNLEAQEVGRTYLVAFLNTFMQEELIKPKSVSLEIQLSLSYIQLHIQENISLTALAEIAALSPSRFKTKFKEEIGITPNIYINQQKVHKAQELLLEGVSITDTAYALGFSSSNYFSTVFKKITAMQPSDYIKQNRNF